jgi:hypothetical protein
MSLDELTRRATKFRSLFALESAMRRRHAPTIVVLEDDDADVAECKRELRRRLIEMGYQVTQVYEVRGRSE